MPQDSITKKKRSEERRCWDNKDKLSILHSFAEGLALLIFNRE